MENPYNLLPSSQELIILRSLIGQSIISLWFENATIDMTGREIALENMGGFSIWSSLNGRDNDSTIHFTSWQKEIPPLADGGEVSISSRPDGSKGFTTNLIYPEPSKVKKITLFGRKQKGTVFQLEPDTETGLLIKRGFSLEKIYDVKTVEYFAIEHENGSLFTVQCGSYGSHFHFDIVGKPHLGKPAINNNHYDADIRIEAQLVIE